MDERMPRTITVRGQGTTTVAPDLARVGLAVDLVRPTASAARAAAAALTGAVIDAIRAAGVAAESIRTSGLSLGPEIEYGQDGRARRIGFRMANRLTVRVTDVALVAPLVDAAIAAGATDLDGVSFEVADARSGRSAALVAAVEDARAAAATLVESAGGRLGPVRTVRELDVAEGGPPRPMLARLETQAAETPVMAGTNDVAAVVEVTWELID